MGSMKKQTQTKETPITINRTLSPFLGIHRAVDEALENFYHVFDRPTFELGRLGSLEGHNLFPAMDIVEAKDHFNVELEMPGMSEEDIEVSINENRLIIKGEKESSKKHEGKEYLSREIQYGCYERNIELPPSADIDKAKASFKKGMLWVTIPKKEGSKNKSRKLKVEKAK